MKQRKAQHAYWVAIILLLLATFYLRTLALADVPPGLTHDEASNGHDASAILTGHHALYFPVGYGHEPLYNYSVALLTYFLGEGIYTLRFTSVIWSLLTWSLTISLSRRWWGNRASVLTASVMGVSFWAQMMGRVGLRAPVLPALFTASIVFFDAAVTRTHHTTRNYLLSGLFLGASFYTYMASRGLPFIYLVFLISLLLTHRAAYRRIWRGTAMALGTAFLTGLPLITYLTLNPELEQRVAQLGGAITAFFNGNWRPLLMNVMDSLPILLWRADPRWLYNIGGRPALEPLLACFLCIGVMVALFSFGKPRHRLLLLWLACGLAPALLTNVEYNTLRAIAAMPATFLLVTLGLDSSLTKLIPILHKPPGQSIQSSSVSSQDILRSSRHGMPLSAGSLVLYAGLLLALIATGVESMHAYFMTWGENRDVRVAYHHAIVSLGRELMTDPSSSPVVISSLYPGQFHDPYTMDVTLGNLRLPLRWVDGRSAVFLPAAQSRLYMDPQTLFPDSLWAFIQPDVQHAHDIIFKPDDIPERIHAYVWDSSTTWTRIRSTFHSDFYAYEEKSNGQQNRISLSSTVNFGDVISLNGYQLSESTPSAGNHIDVLTAWSITHPYTNELVIFMHLLDEDGNILTQHDFLAAPSWQWETGDRFVHQHELILPSSMKTGRAMIAVGLYQRDDLTRLPILSPIQNLTRTIIHLEIKNQ